MGKINIMQPLSDRLLPLVPASNKKVNNEDAQDCLISMKLLMILCLCA